MASVLSQVLRVADDFDEFGGASAELVSWELGIAHELVHASWGRAIDQGLLSPAPADQIFGEAMWRVSAAGRRWLDGQPAVAPPAAKPTRFVAQPTVRRTRSAPSTSPRTPLHLTH